MEYPERNMLRRDITGAPPGWQISGTGVVYKNQRREKTDRSLAGLPTVIIPDYCGPVRPAGRCWYDDSDTLADVKAKDIINSMRLVDELVCFEFHGAPDPNARLPRKRHRPIPPGGWWPAVHVAHKDGDAENCARDNVEWSLDEDYLAEAENRRIRNLLRPDNLPPRVKIAPPMKTITPLAFVSSNSLAGWRPIPASNPHEESAARATA
ncbi:hypothetical protein [[Mycobacterium] crassicus]|uniref:HNH nuclease domain-containing protein n=1 Tax=[Mycobacterium] crassicus TaxID=2872309 RepID=A0ABU5XP28_9MYCO|nr:hypothetical protein [Mycolicibacter sp. MYC098]MEB3023923.1 hypothetical protein [Mycolicibacter sp. MYC098]